MGATKTRATPGMGRTRSGRRGRGASWLSLLGGGLLGLGSLLGPTGCAVPADEPQELPAGSGGRSSSGGSGDDANPGSPHRNRATLVARGSVLGEISARYSGYFSPATAGASYVQCTHQGGELRVLAGEVGTAPVVQLTLRDPSTAEPFAKGFRHEADAQPPALQLVVRPARSSAGGAYEYEFGRGEGGTPVSYCSVEAFDFDQHALSAVVACRDLVATAQSVEGRAGAPVTATLTVDCSLSLADGSSGGGEPGLPQPAECSAGEERVCFGLENGCEGVQTCEGDTYGECVCPAEPSLLLKLLFPGTAYESTMRQTTGNGLSSTVSSLAADGYVVTVGMANNVPYTLIGVREVGTTRKFEAIMRQTNGPGLSTVASALAADGYVITVGMANTVPYTLIGVREVGSTKTYEASVRQTSGPGLSAAAAALGSDGYVITTAMANEVPYTLIGVREVGAIKAYETVVHQTTGNGLSTTAANMAGQGFVLTAATANTAPYTLFGVRDAALGGQLSSTMRQTDGNGLTSTITSMSQGGHIVLAGTANTVPYTLFGTKVTLVP